MNGIIYVATCTIHGKVYVGQTVRTLEERRYQHLMSKRNLPFPNALRLFGIDKFTWEILHEGVQTMDELNRLETETIAVLDSANPMRGYNCSQGRRRQWGTAKRGGRKPIPGGRVRITVNLPPELLPFLKSLAGRSLSNKIVGLVQKKAPESSGP